MLILGFLIRSTCLRSDKFYSRKAELKESLTSYPSSLAVPLLACPRCAQELKYLGHMPQTRRRWRQGVAVRRIDLDEFQEPLCPYSQ